MRILLLFLFFGLSLFASIGKVSALNGKVIIDRQKQILEANIGFDLEEKDLVSTDDKSKAQITLNDGTVLSLGKNSKLDINEYVFDEKNSSNSKAEFKFAEGTFKSITGAIGKVAPEKFKLETKSASIGIRGTIVVGNQEKVACTHGQIAVTSAGVTQILRAGMMTTTEIGKPPTPPTKIEGNLLKEVDNVGSKEENKSSSTESSASNKSTEKSEQNEVKSESQSQQNSTVQSATTQTNPIVNLTTLNDVVKVANNVITQTSSDTTLAETTAAEAKKKAEEETARLKAEAIASATTVITQSTTVVENISSSATAVSALATTVSQITQNLSADITNDVQTIVDASTTANELSTQSQSILLNITNLLAQAQTATSEEAIKIYEQIKTSSSKLTNFSSQAIDASNVAQNKFKTVNSNLANTINTQTLSLSQNISSVSTTVSNLTTTVTQMSQTADITNDSQTALNTATEAATTASKLSSQAQALTTELSGLSEKLKTASLDEIVNLYKNIQTKSNALSNINSELTQTALIVQNNFKIVIINLASSINTQSTVVAQNISSVSTNTTASSRIATQTAQDASSKAQTEAIAAKNAAIEAASTASQLSAQAQGLLAELTTLLEQAKNTTATEAIAIYEQIKTSSNTLSSLFTQVTDASNSALNSSKAVVNVPFYSTSLDIAASGNNSVGSQIFSVSQDNTTVTIATFTKSSGMDPVLILLKKNKDGEYQLYNARDDDSWTKSPYFYNSILNLKLEHGDYKITVANYPFYDQESVNLINEGDNLSGTINLYITSSSVLTFDSSIEKYSYITKYNNQAYINNPNYTNAKIEENNASFGILADSKVGTTIKIDNYGYFVTISDSFDYTKNVFLNPIEVDDGSSWGYWTDANSSKTLSTIRNMQSVWVSGNKVTPATDYKATFTGQVIGSVKNDSSSGYIKLDSNNLFKATIDIGSASISNSTIKFNDSLENSWNGKFDTSGTANVNQQGFNSSIIGTGTTGSLSGKYYGTTNSNATTTVQSIGGSFNMNQGTSTANGVFKAKAGAQ